MVRKSAFYIFIIIGVLLTAACSAEKASNQGVVVETEAGNITEEDFYNELKERYGQDLLKEMVLVKILEDKYEVKDKEIDNEVKEAKDQLGDQFEVWLASQGFQDEESFRYAVRISLLNEKAVYDGVDIPEKEMKEYYNRMKTEIQARHILVKDEKTAKKVKQKLDKGEKFDQLAKEYSTDTSNANDGGKLDYFSVGSMVPEFEEAVFNMDVGQVSDPVKTQYGYHIVEVTDKRDKKQTGTYEENKEMILTTLKQKKVNPNEAERKIDQLLEDTKIDVKTDEFKDLFKKKDVGLAESDQ